MNILIITYL